MKLATPEQLRAMADSRNPYQRLDSVRLSEPRLEMIYQRLNALLQVVQLEADGVPVDIDGFRLRDPAQWTSRAPSPLSELWHISTACNMRCPFCYEEGDPQGVSVINEPAEMATLQEIETRLKYYDPLHGTGLFQPLTYINEIFCNPRAMEIMERLRAASPHEVLTFVTNGTYLDEPTVARIAQLKPVFFNFSVNSLDPVIRRKILRDPQPEVAIQALDLLRAYGVPYLGSLVCWPTIPWSDIEQTVRRLDQAGCAIVRFSLSAYSKHLKGRRYNREEFWQQGLAVARALMEEVEIPIKVEPYHYMDQSFLPRVAGVIKGSPAARAGIRAGDLILTVEGRAMPTANHALSALATTARRRPQVQLTYQGARDGCQHSVVLDNQAGPSGYPYDQMLQFAGFEWGLVLIDNLKFSYLQEMRELIDAHQAHRVLLCSSALMKPIVLQMLAVSQAFTDLELAVEVPENRYFGGSIVLGDLLTVEDYVAFIQAYRQRAGLAPELVLIPSSPFSRGEWLRDLTGTPFTEIERRTGVAVALIHCKPVNG